MITSQLSGFEVFDGMKAFRVPSFSDATGSAFLLYLLDHDILLQGDQSGAASAISNVVGGLPLALTQLAGFMRETRCSFAQLLTLLKKHSRFLWEMPTTASFWYPHTVNNVFDLAFSELSVDSWDLMRFMSVLHADGELLQGTAYELINQNVDTYRYVNLLSYITSYLRLQGYLVNSGRGPSWIITPGATRPMLAYIHLFGCIHCSTAPRNR